MGQLEWARGGGAVRGWGPQGGGGGGGWGGERNGGRRADPIPSFPSFHQRWGVRWLRRMGDGSEGMGWSGGSLERRVGVQGGEAPGGLLGLLLLGG